MDGPVEIELERDEPGSTRTGRRRHRRSGDTAHARSWWPSPRPPSELWAAVRRRRGAFVVAVAFLLLGVAIGRVTAPGSEGSETAPDSSGSPATVLDPPLDPPPPDPPERDPTEPDSTERDSTEADTTVPLPTHRGPTAPGSGAAAIAADGAVTSIGDGPLLPGLSGLEVIGLTPHGSLLEIDLDGASMRVIDLPLDAEDLVDGGYVYARRDLVLVGSNSSGRAYVVGRDRTVRPAPDVIGARGGPAFAGPGPNDVWVHGFGETMLDARRLHRVDVGDGGVSGDPLDLDWFDYAVGDGQGGVLVHAVGGWYLIDDTGGRYLTSGQLVASGSDHLLAVECPRRDECETIVIDRTSDERRSVAGRAVGPGTRFEPASLAPDGSVLVARDRLDERSPWRLIDLEGDRIRTLVSIWGDAGAREEGAGPAWSDDGRFVLLPVRRQLWFHDRETTATRAVAPGRSIPDLLAFDVRPEPGPGQDQRVSSPSSARSGAAMSSRASATMRLK